MTKQSKTVRKVEDLERFGKMILDIPDDAFKGQGLVIFAAFRKKFGLFGLIPFAIRVLLERRKLLKKYAAQYEKIYKLSKSAANECTMMVAIFNAIEKKESREKAYEFIKSIFQVVALKSLPALYQLDDLVKCDGDVFDNYKKFNMAMFKASNRDFHIQEIEENDNHLRIVVDRCLNVEAGLMFDCPEFAQLGCDHDLASYPYVDPQVNSEFRRPCTLAKGGNYCDFNFYRKGFAPQGAFENQ